MSKKKQKYQKPLMQVQKIKLNHFFYKGNRSFLAFAGSECSNRFDETPCPCGTPTRFQSC